MRHYCTLFDRNYLERGLALHRSLVRHCREFRLYVLCLDAATHQALSALALPGVGLLQLADLESWDAGLAAARQNRETVGFYFTCKPVLLAYLFARDSSMERLEYLDSDLWFLSDPDRAAQSYAGSSVALSPHRFDSANAWRRQYGEFNAGWVSVSSFGEGQRFVSWWRARCLEWCGLAVEKDRFGDQKYLDQVPALFPSTARVTQPAINVGPWNISGQANAQPLVLFHFHGMRRLLFGVYETGLHHYGVELTAALSRGLYRPYVAELAACRKDLRAVLPETSGHASWLDYGRELRTTAAALARRKAVAPA